MIAPEQTGFHEFVEPGPPDPAHSLSHFFKWHASQREKDFATVTGDGDRRRVAIDCEGVNFGFGC